MKRNIVEWAVLAVSVLAIGLLVAALVVEGVSEHRPANPQVELRPEEARQGSLGWIVPAIVTNDGDEAVEAVILEAEAMVDGESEVRELEVPFLPAASSVEVAFSFSALPSSEIVVRLVGFRLP